MHPANINVYLERADYHIKIGSQILAFARKHELDIAPPWTPYQPLKNHDDLAAYGFHIEDSDDKSGSWCRRDFPNHPMFYGLHVIVCENSIEVWCNVPGYKGKEIQIIRRKLTQNDLLEVLAFVEIW